MEVCVLCRETITNPVCADCLQREIATWLNEVNPSLLDEFRVISKDIILNSFNSGKCVICGNSMNVCAYCYTEHILGWLTDRVKNTKLIKEFMQYFNFDLEHKGYEHKLRMEGYEW